MEEFKKLMNSVKGKELNEEERINFLNDAENAVRGILYDMNIERADGSLSKLCNLSNEFSWAEYLDVFLDDYRENNGIDYDKDNYEVVKLLNNDEFCELVETIRECVEQEVFEFKEYKNSLSTLSHLKVPLVKVSLSSTSNVFPFATSSEKE